MVKRGAPSFLGRRLPLSSRGSPSSIGTFPYPYPLVAPPPPFAPPPPLQRVVPPLPDRALLRSRRFNPRRFDHSALTMASTTKLRPLETLMEEAEPPEGRVGGGTDGGGGAVGGEGEAPMEEGWGSRRRGGEARIEEGIHGRGGGGEGADGEGMGEPPERRGGEPLDGEEQRRR